jgi:ABC-type sugar transport system ATPase subunit
MNPSSQAVTTPAGNNIIEARGLVKRYGDVVALNGLDLTVSVVELC